MDIISSKDNEIVKNVRKLKEKKYRDLENAYIVEGIKMVKEAIFSGTQFVGVENDKIIAAYIMNHDCDKAYHTVQWHIDAGEKEVVILHALRVLPDYGGRGYSKQLVEHAVQTAKSWGQKAIRLDCIVGNDVPVKVYTSFGFEYVDTVRITYADIGVPMEFRLYELVLQGKGGE